MKVLSTLAVSAAALFLAANGASATPISGTFGVTIYQADCGTSCTISSPDEQAQAGNPLITPSDEISSGTYTGALNWLSGGTGDGSLATFLASAGGTYTGATSNGSGPFELSSAPFDLTTIFVITGNAGGTISGTITHDDGVSLYDGPSYSNTVLNSATPTSADTSPYSGLNGNFEIVYAEDNGLPAELDMEVTNRTPVPEPLTLSVFGVGLAGAAAMRLRGRKKTNAA